MANTATTDTTTTTDATPNMRSDGVPDTGIAIKFAVTVPAPFTVAVVELDDVETKAILPVAFHDENS